jgi:hypothetical protein
MNARVLLWGIVIAAAIGGNADAASPQPRIIYAVDSIAALQALDGAKYPDVSVTGFYAGMTKGGGMFAWQADSAAPPDNCTVFPAAQKQGRWLRRMGNVLDVTMCGAKWDNAADDSAAIALAFTTASRSGYSVSCPGGTANIATTMAPASFANVIFRCQGMGASTINCTVPAGRPCFLFQNPIGLNAIQAPQITDVSFTAPSGPRAPGAVIQYNSIAGGFTDTAQTQDYMMRPIVQRVTILGGGIGIQCSKCFDGDFSLNTLTNQERHGFDLEGSDWMSIGDAGSNRIAYSGDYPILLVSHGTFGNGDLVSHNDILAPRQGVKAYIYSSARTSYLEKNFLEGETHGACEIKIDQGASHVLVQGNHVTDRTVDHWLCVVPMLRQADFSNNQTTSHGQGPALFENRGTWKDLLFHHAIVHSGNWSESGFPGFWPIPALRW